MNVRVNGRETELGGRYIGADLRDSTDIVGESASLRERLREDGFVLVRGLLDRDAVLDTRRALLEPLHASGALDPAAPLVDGLIRDVDPPPAIGADWKTPELRSLTTSRAMTGFFERLLGGDVRLRSF